MRSYKKMNVEDKKGLIVTLLFVCFIFMLNIGYSVMKAQFNITGEAVIRVIEDIRITDIKPYEVSGATFNYDPRYSKNTIEMSSSLSAKQGDNANYASYIFTVTNTGTAAMRINEVCDAITKTCPDSGYNTNYFFSVYNEDTEEWKKINNISSIGITQGETKILITFENNTTSDVTISKNIKFSFERIISILANPNGGAEGAIIFKGPIANNEVEEINFRPTVDVVDGAIGFWDASRAKDGNVIASYKDADNNGLYEVYIGGYGYVVPYDCGALFYNYTQLVTVNFGEEIEGEYINYFETSDIVDKNGNVINNAITSLSYTFSNCKKLQKLNLSAFDTSKVTNMTSMFSHCHSLQTIELGESFTIENLESMRHMFVNCYKLEKIDLSNFIATEKLTDVNRLFDSCNTLEEIKLNDNFLKKHGLTSMNQMFYDCFALKSINLKGFNTSKVTNFSYMFHACESLTKIDVSLFDTAKATTMKYMFSRCEKLEELNGLENFNTQNVTDMQRMFQLCYMLDQIDVSNFNTQKLENMNYMFDNCHTLTELDVSNFNTSEVTNMQGTFANCNILEKIKFIPDSGNITFVTNKVTRMDELFANDWNLRELNLSGFITTEVTTMNSMFKNCYRIKTLDLSNLNMTKVTDVTHMFSALSNYIDKADIILKNVDSSMYSNTYLQTALNTIPPRAEVEVTIHVKDETSKTAIEEFRTSNFKVQIYVPPVIETHEEG